MAGSGEKKRSTIERMDDEIVKMVEELSHKYSIDLSAVIFSPDADGKVAEKTLKLDQQSIKEVEDILKNAKRKAQKEIEEQKVQALLYKTLAGGDIRGEDPQKLKKVSEMIEEKMAELFPERELIGSRAPVVEDLPKKSDSAGN